ncbi:MAG: D-alanyl-D-alanine carboxypeptidase [Muribaculaceae bacterium]|nr:D-alanyl-D-alanine carboxypeptidase [Muribaculaceae bacterium]
MTTKSNNRFLPLFLLLALLLLPHPLLGADDAMRSCAREGMTRFASSRAIAPSRSAVLITDLADGAEITSLNPDLPLVPASIMKTVTIASLLSQTGPDWKYRTHVKHDGRIKDGILEGNLIVEASGDPSISSSCEPVGSDFASEVVTALREKGVRHIVGRVIIDETRFPGPSCPSTWASGDLPHSYGTGSHGLNYRNNASGKKAVTDPSGWFRRDLGARLADAGIDVEGLSMPHTGRHTLFTHESAPVEEIMRSCMMRSDNLFAESMLRTLGSLKGEEGSTLAGTAFERELWKKRKAPLDGVELVDGSGLSRSNRVTARFMESVLRHEKDNVEYASFMPLAGQEGTLKKFLASTPLDSYVAMKTGSMNGIQCYAGYKLDEEFAPTHAIVVILNALPAGRPAARAAVEQLLLDIFAPQEEPEAAPQ